MAAELRERAAYHLPPFSRLASITVSGHDAPQVIAAANQLAASAPRHDKLRILGPAPAPFAVLRGRHRHRLMVQAPRNVALSTVIRDWLATQKLPRTVKVQADIDPYSFL